MPKEKPPRFPVGLTLDQAVARGWRPGLGRKLIATDDGPIREVGPDDVWVDPVDQPRRRRRSSGDDSVRARIRDTMARYRAAERERKRKPKRGSRAIIKALLPAPSDEATPCLAKSAICPIPVSHDPGRRPDQGLSRTCRPVQSRFRSRFHRLHSTCCGRPGSSRSTRLRLTTLAWLLLR